MTSPLRIQLRRVKSWRMTAAQTKSPAGAETGGAYEQAK